MPHIHLPEGLTGVGSCFEFRPETGGPLRAFVEALLRGPSPLSSGERETIATFVSYRNECEFCRMSHRAAAAHHLGGDYATVDAVCADYRTAPVSEKLRALLAVAEKARLGGKNVLAEDVAAARDAGASDVEIHDTVLIAAAFAMFSRYVDGLAAETPTDEDVYDEMGARLAFEGYVLRR